jgi:uncharacterized DUF497 family protein
MRKFAACLLGRSTLLLGCPEVLAMEFEWDRRKAAANLAKHGVSFNDVTTVFDDPMALTFVDAEHSDLEQRFLTFGVMRRRQVGRRVSR